MSDMALETLDAKHGRFTLPKNDLYIARSLREYGEFCEAEMMLMSQLIKPGDVVVDAGANIGAFSVPLARQIGPKGRLYSFEPQPFICTLLSHNLIQNQCLNARCFTMALGADRGDISVPNFNYAASLNFGGISFHPDHCFEEKGNSVKIPSLPLDQVIDPPKLRLIKADVEKMEAMFLKGALGLIKEHSPFMLLECDAPLDFAPIAEILWPLDYALYWHISPLFLKQNWAEKTQDIFGNITTINLFAAPKDVPVSGLQKAETHKSHPKFKA